MYHTICFQNWALISVVLARFLKSLLTCLKSTKQALRGYRTYHIVKRGRNVYLRQVPANDDDQGIDIWAVEKDLWAPLPSFESFVVGLDLIQSFWFIVLDRYSKWKLQSAGSLFQNLQRGAMRCHLGPCCLGMSRGVIEKRELRKGVFPWIEFTPVPLLHFALAIEFACFGWVFCLIALAAGCVAFFPIRHFLL